MEADSPVATTSQLQAAGTDAEELATVHERRAGLVGARDIKAAEFWYGEATKYFSRAKADARMLEALGKQAKILLRMRTMGSLEKASAVLERAYDVLPSFYESTKRDVPVWGVSDDASLALFRGDASPGLLVGRIDKEELPSRKMEGTATPIGVYEEGVVVLADGATADTSLLKFISLRGGEPSVVPVPIKPKKVDVIGDSQALIVGKHGTKQQLWRVGPNSATRLLEFELGEGWISDSYAIQSMRANSKGSFALAVGRSKMVSAAAGDALVSNQSLEIFGANNVKISEVHLSSRLDFSELDGDLTKLTNALVSAEMGELGAVSIAPDGTKALAFLSAFVPSQSKWIFLDSRGKSTALQVPTDKVMIPVLPPEEGPIIPLKDLPEHNQSSPLFPAAPKGLPPQGWNHASFSTDGQRIIVSNWVGGILVFDMDGRLLSRIAIPQWDVTTTTETGLRRATVVPFGHIWRNSTEIVVGGVQYRGSESQPFLLNVNVLTGKVNPVPTSRTVVAQLRGWSWKEGSMPTPLIVAVKDELHVVSLPGKEYILKALPSFEEIGRLTTSVADPLVEDWAVGTRMPSASGLVADFRTGRLDLGDGAAKNAAFSVAVARPDGTVFVDVVPDGQVDRAIVRRQESGKLLGSFVVRLPKNGFRILQWGECLAFVESDNSVDEKSIHQVSWLRIGKTTGVGEVRWQGTSGRVEGLRCSSESKAAVLLFDSKSGAVGWQEGLMEGKQPNFFPLPGWVAVPNSYRVKQRAPETSRLLFERSGSKNEAFILGNDSSGSYKVLAGPLGANSLVTNRSLSVIGAYKDGQVELRRIESGDVYASSPVAMRPDSVLEHSLLVKERNRFSLWPFLRSADPTGAGDASAKRLNVPISYNRKFLSSPPTSFQVR